MAHEWWDPEGKFKLLHEINPYRIKYIKAQIIKALKLTPKNQQFQDLKLLDVGCGGGLISVPMKLLGANVTGIDASPNNIATANKYCSTHNIDINFLHTTVEDMADEFNNKYDVILALEIIEHVADYKLFLNKVATLLKDNGVLIITTINRTLKSLAFAKIGAEYILRLLPIGTHDWHKFLTPKEIQDELIKYNTMCFDLSGMAFRPLGLFWQIGNDIDTKVNYLMTFKKGGDK